MIPTHEGALVHYLCFKKAVPDSEGKWKFENGERPIDRPIALRGGARLAGRQGFLLFSFFSVRFDSA